MTWQSCFCKRLFRSTSTWLFKSVQTLQSPVVNLRELFLPFNSPIFEIETQFTSRLFLLCLKFAFCNSGRLLRIVCRSGIWEKMNCLYSVLGDNQMSVVSETRFTSRRALIRHLQCLCVFLYEYNINRIQLVRYNWQISSSRVNTLSPCVSNLF